MSVALVLALLAIDAAPSASAAKPWWHLAVRYMPSTLTPGTGRTIVVTLANLGDSTVDASAAPIQISTRLPAGISVETLSGTAGTFGSGGPVECDATISVCSYSGLLHPYEQVELLATLAVSASAAGSAEVGVSGGGLPSTSLTRALVVTSAPPSFGIDTFEVRPEDDTGQAELQAGAHPFQLSTTLALNQTTDSLKPPALVRNLGVSLPAGVVGNTLAVPQCAEFAFLETQNFVNSCPPATQIGVASVTLDEPKLFGRISLPVPVFNLIPTQGEPARFGFVALNVPVLFDTAVRSSGDYGVNVNVTNVTQSAALISSEVTIWGVPGDPRHDLSRGWECVWTAVLGTPCVAPAEHSATPFLRMPTACDQVWRSLASGESWPTHTALGGVSAPIVDYVERDVRGQALTPTGCNKLPFEPAVSVSPDVHSAQTPAGLTVGIHVPQEALLTAGDLAAADVKRVSMALPAGLQVSPASATGLAACSTAAMGFTGPGPQGLAFSGGPAECDDSTKIGVVEEIKTPLLSRPLTGAMYLAAQNSNPFGSLIAVYLVAEEPSAGVRIKLAGDVGLDPQTGQLSATFDNTPQLPFEDLKVRLFGGDRAPLTTPPACGDYATTASLTPWSQDEQKTSTSTFGITAGPAGAGCLSPLPFSPSLGGGATDAGAGLFTPFTVEFGRQDGEQSLSRVNVHMPLGVLGMLSSVAPCQEPQAAQATCGDESLIGRATASVGLGPTPYTISGGKVFLTGPYAGAPYGLTIAEPAKAGPFDLGTGPCDCVVVRAKIEVDPRTAAITVASDPLPVRLQGVPLQIKHVQVQVDRSRFVFNPTNCRREALSAAFQSDEGLHATQSAVFQAVNCATLPFSPGFKVLTHARTSKAAGAYLHVRVTSAAGQANIAAVKVNLPIRLPSRLVTLQKACLAKVFANNPATCPPGSVIGSATALTPVLKSALMGPAYLVSHGGAAFPDLEIVLSVEGITLVLDGATQIKNGITSSTFRTVPDAPITSFDLVLPRGPHSALAAFGNLCRGALRMPTAIVGQNGITIKRTTVISVTGCPRRHPTRRRAAIGTARRRKRASAH